MAKPRVFISSTYYDLKYIRASLEIFVDSLGFEPVLSEKGDIAYSPDRALDESCYIEVENSDILVLIVGGRYGSPTSAGSKAATGSFFARYESITKAEYGRAVEKDIPIYVLIEKGVNSEYQTYLRNKDVTNIQYAHVDSVNVFILIEEILSKPRNNPVQSFEKFEEIELWLREQWAGLFRELLRRQSQQQQLTGLSAQVTELKETNETLKKYLEAVMRGVGQQETSQLIASEEARLTELRRTEALRENRMVHYLKSRWGVPIDDVVAALLREDTLIGFSDRFASTTNSDVPRALLEALLSSQSALRDFNEARRLLNLLPLVPTDLERALHESHLLDTMECGARGGSLKDFVSLKMDDLRKYLRENPDSTEIPEKGVGKKRTTKKANDK